MPAVPNRSLIADTQRLISEFNSQPKFRSIFEKAIKIPGATYRRRPVRLYVWVIGEIVPVYRKYYTLTKSDPSQISNLLRLVWTSNRGQDFRSIEKNLQGKPNFLSDQELTELDRIDQLPEGTQKNQVYEKFIEKKVQEKRGGGGKPKTEPEAEKPKTPPQLQQKTAQPPKAPPVPAAPPLTEKPLAKSVSFLRIFAQGEFRNLTLNFLSQTQIALRKIISRYPLPSASVLTGMFGGIIGLGATGTLEGMSLGAATGGVLPGAIKSGLVTKLGGNAAKGLVGIGNTAAMAAVGPAGWAAAGVSIFVRYKWWIIGTLVAVAFLILGIDPTNMRQNIALLFDKSGSLSGSSSNSVLIQKTGPLQVANGADIEYKIQVTYKGTGSADIEVTDQIDPKTEFINADSGGEATGGAVKWVIKGVSPNTPKTLGLTIKPKDDDIWVVNQANARIIRTTGGYGATSFGLLPSNLLPPPPNWDMNKNTILAKFNQYSSNTEIYKQASQITGVPWELLAGIHYIEGTADPKASLVSGRRIGTPEPDIPLIRCSEGFGPGIPIKIEGGCGFSSLLDSAIYAGNHIKEKLGGNAPQSFQDTVTALSRYNGGGNRNCYLEGDERNPRTPYQYCPREFEGEDDIYPMSQFDQKHSIMYLVYVGDGTADPNPKVYQRYGVMAIIRALLGK